MNFGLREVVEFCWFWCFAPAEGRPQVRARTCGRPGADAAFGGLTRARRCEEFLHLRCSQMRPRIRKRGARPQKRTVFRRRERESAAPIAVDADPALLSDFRSCGEFSADAASQLRPKARRRDDRWQKGAE